MNPHAATAHRPTQSAFYPIASVQHDLGRVAAPAMSLRHYIITVLLVAYAWETVEHYLEADSWAAVMFWMQGVEFWGNRVLADPAAVLAGALVHRAWGTPQFVTAVRIAIAAWLFVHIVVFDDCMVLQRMLPSVGNVFGDKATAWTDIWTLDHFMSGVSIGAVLMPVGPRQLSRPARVTSAFRIPTAGVLLVATMVLAPVVDAQRIRLTTLLGESTGLVAPVIVAIDRRGATEWRGSVTGWTVSGAYTRNLTPQRAWLAQLDLTPINARLSNRQFVDGELIDFLGYQNSSVQLSGGPRFTPRPRWTTELRGVVLHEFVNDLPAATEAFWERPYMGLDITQRYERLRADDPLRTRIAGVPVVARAQGFAGDETMWRGLLFQGGIAAPAGAWDRPLITASVGSMRVR